MGYPSFDQNITQKNSQSKEKTEIRITFGDKTDPIEVEEAFGFTMMAVQDIVYTDMPTSEITSYDDLFENYPLIACFVTAEDPVIQYYTSRIQQKLLKGETAGVTNTIEEGIRFMKGIYEATRRSGMVYSSTGGVPASIGDVQTLVQRIRLPREVVTGNTGLCTDTYGNAILKYRLNVEEQSFNYILLISGILLFIIGWAWLFWQRRRDMAQPAKG
jgi:hypothetical protein